MLECVLTPTLPLRLHALQTPLGTQLDRKVVRPFVTGPAQAFQLQKPVLVLAGP